MSGTSKRSAVCSGHGGGSAIIDIVIRCFIHMVLSLIFRLACGGSNNPFFTMRKQACRGWATQLWMHRAGHMQYARMSAITSESVSEQ